MALRGDRGDLGPRPDAAIFADTGWEPRGVYEHLAWLELQLSYPVHRVSIGHRLQDRLREGLGHDGRHFHDPPLFTLDHRGRKGQGARQCTTQYKLVPIRRAVRALLEYGQRAYIPATVSVDMWLGISTDEAARMKPSQVGFIRNTYPLIDIVPMSRQDCLAWWTREYPGRPLVKSACVGCPYHSAATWVQVRKDDPIGFADAVKIDAAIRVAGTMQQFLHARRLPLAAAVDLDERKVKTAQSQGSLWDDFTDECEGLCGV